MRIALIDLDGVVADSSARFAKAEEAKAAYITQHSNPVYQASEREATSVYWQTAFTPELVTLDTLIAGAARAIMLLEEAGYKIYFLTSRPDPMRDATRKWIKSQYISCWPDKLIMKPASQQFVKTVVWKSGVVELLVRLFGVDDLLFIDDEVATQEAIAALDLPCDRKIGGSLQEAVAMLAE